MHFQDPSLLQFQKRLEKQYHRSNLQSLFDIKKIPESTQLRDIIDHVESDYFNSFFNDYFYRLQRGKQLLQYQLFPGLYLAPMDGTEYYSSPSIFCDSCLKTRTKKTLQQSEEDIHWQESTSEKKKKDMIAGWILY